MNRRVLLITTVLVGLVAWLVITIASLTLPPDSTLRLLALLAGAVAVLAFLLVMMLGCSCLPRRAPFEPATAGTSLGAAIGITLMIPFAVYVCVGHLAEPHAYPGRVRELALSLGAVGGLVVFLLILAGLIVCAKGRRDADGETDPIPPAAVRKLPDPWIYSQDWARTVGDPVTWDNPSVTIWNPATLSEESRFDLISGQLYRLMVEIQNGTAVTPAEGECIGATLTCYQMTFGIGGGFVDWLIPPGSPLLIPSIPARRAGDPPRVEIVEFNYTPALSGHACLVFLIQHPDDANPGNNKGQHNLEVTDAAAGSALSVTVPVWNRLPEPPEFRFPRRSQGLVGLMRRIGAYVVYPLSRPVLWARRYRPTEIGAPPRPVPPTLGDRQVVELELRQWPGRRDRRPDKAWEIAVDKPTLELPVVDWSDTDAKETPVAVSVRVPEEARAGTSRLISLTGTAAGRLVGGVSILVRVS